MKVLIFDSDMLVRNDLKLMFELNGGVCQRSCRVTSHDLL